MNYILGLNIANHDSSAALLKNGELIAYAEQERFSRNKLALGEAPVEAIKFCLETAHISIRNIHAIAVGMDWKYRNNRYSLSKSERDKYQMFENSDWFLPKHEFGNIIPPIYPIKHHFAHAASAYRLSGYKDCAILVADNRGEDSSTSLGYVKDGKIIFFKQIPIHNSLGIFYNRACEYTGLYGKHREVGKLMGLSSYGIPNMDMPLQPDADGNLFKKLPSLKNKSISEAITERNSQLLEFFAANCFPYQSGNTEEIMSYANFAASVQKSLEDTLLMFVRELKEKNLSDNLVIAGGIAQNCSANGKIEKSGLFRHIFIPPFVSDAGTAVGAALELNFNLFGKKCTDKPLSSAALGAKYDKTEILAALNRYTEKLSFEYITDNSLFDNVAEKLANGKIIAWMQGKFEGGPRALGNRSLLADPRTRRSLIKLNNIKQREMWRPIAPSILAEHYKDYFLGDADNKYFMNIATQVRPDKQTKIPAVTHIDGTARPQAVTPEIESYYKLIQSFYRLTDTPVLCNTSFNSRGVPLVNTPENALHCFLEHDIDFLVMENFLIAKK